MPVDGVPAAHRAAWLEELFELVHSKNSSRPTPPGRYVRTSASHLQGPIGPHIHHQHHQHHHHHHNRYSARLVEWVGMASQEALNPHYLPGLHTPGPSTLGLEPAQHLPDSLCGHAACVIFVQHPV